MVRIPRVIGVRCLEYKLNLLSSIYYDMMSPNFNRSGAAAPPALRSGGPCWADIRLPFQGAGPSGRKANTRAATKQPRFRSRDRRGIVFHQQRNAPLRLVIDPDVN